MKAMRCAVFLLVLFFRLDASTVTAAGHLVSDETWGADTVLVTDTVWVDSGVTLTVDPGTRVEFQGYYRLYIWGRILAQGLAADSIVFTAPDTATGWRSIRFDGISSANDTSRFSFCRIEYTRAAGSGHDAWGGGIFIYGFSKVRIENCLFYRNRGQSYGGGFSSWSSSMVLVNNTFRENSASAGGGICINGGTPVVSGNLVTSNSASTGGGIYCLNTSATLRLTDNIISRNSATNNGGGVTSAISGSVKLVNCLINNNSANLGGGLFTQIPQMVLINCTVVNNTATTNSGGLYSSNTDTAAAPVLTNVVLWGNTAGGVPNQLGLNNPTVRPKIRNCDIQGGAAGFSGSGVPSIYTGNLDLDPLFVDSTGGDYTVSQASPCVNSGTPDTAGLGLPAQDLAGSPRIHDGAIDRIDMGAYEYAGDPADYLLVTYPGSGTSLSAGTLCTVTWTSVGTVGSVRIEYSIDSGNTWKEIAASAPNTGSYDWLVPDQPSAACAVRVSEAADGFPLDESDGSFSIVQGEYKLVSPNDGSERWRVGSTHDITWTSLSGTGSVRLEYSTDSAQTWKLIAASAANSGSYSWNVPNDPSFACKVRISEAATGYPLDESDNLFGIYDSTLLVICGLISEDMVWDMDTVRVDCPVTVDTGVTLTINPGTRVEFMAHYPLNVRGRLLAAGAPLDSIVFTAPDTTPSAAGGWAGIRFRDVGAQSDTSRIDYCRIEYVRTFGSSLDGYGGGVFVYGFSKVIVSNSTIKSNIALNGGAGICAWLASPVIRNNTIRNNTTTDAVFSFGAGIFCQSSSALISDNVIRNNQSSREGGGIACQGGAPRIFNNLIYSNTAGNEGGGIRCIESSNPLIINNLIRGNQAVDGGGVFCNLSPLRLFNNTIVGNRGTNGGGLRTESTSPSVRNNIIWNNTGGQIVYGLSGSATVEYCAVQGGWTGTGNIDVYPVFTDSAAGNFTLQSSSPSINTGTPDTAGLFLPALDLAGNVRIFSGRVDMGAYEYQSLIAPLTPVLVSPANGAVNQPVPLTAVWRMSAGADTYHIQMATDTGFTAMFLEDSTITDTLLIVSGLSCSTTYYWRVRARNVVGVSAWSGSWSFTTAVAPPSAPALVSPSDGAVGQPLSLSLVWNTTGGAASYQVQVAADSGFTTLLVQDSSLTDTTRAITGLANNTVYYWRVRAKNAGGVSGWSGFRSFTTIVAPPSTPVLVSPSDSAAGQPVSLSALWNMAAGADTYHIQVATDTGFTAVFLQDSTITDSQLVVNGLAYSTVYYWRVRAKNTAGVSGWSGFRRFTTIVAPPSTPVLVSPSDGAAGQPVSLTLVWNPVSGAVSYHVQVATDTGFTVLFAQDSSQADTTNAVTGLDNDVTYYWRVRAKNAGGTGAWSSARSFTTIITLPSAVVILSPADSTVIDVDSVQLSWHVATPAVDRYLIEVATDSAMTALAFLDSTVTDSTLPVTSLANNTTYYWRVKAHNAAGWGDYSTETRFVTSFVGVLYGGNGIYAFSMKYQHGMLRYTLPDRCYVSVKYYDIRGRMVGSFVNSPQGEGSHMLRLPLSSLGTGAYIQVFMAGEVVRKDRIMVVK